MRPPTLKEFAQEFGEHFISTEGAIWRTLRMLLTQPGRLTREYWTGRRKHFVLPLRLYLTVSVLVLIAFKLFGAFHLDSATEFTVANELRQQRPVVLFDVATFGQWSRLGPMAIDKDVFTCVHLPQWICQRVETHVHGEPDTVARWLSGVFDRAAGHTGQAMFFLLPLFAVWSKFLYRNQGRFYTEHLVFALHLHAFFFVMLLVSTAPVAGAKAVALIGAMAYFMVSLQTVFGGALWKNLWRGAFIAILHGAVIATALHAMLIWAFTE